MILKNDVSTTAQHTRERLCHERQLKVVDCILTFHFGIILCKEATTTYVHRRTVTLHYVSPRGSLPHQNESKMIIEHLVSRQKVRKQRIAVTVGHRRPPQPHCIFFLLRECYRRTYESYILDIYSKFSISESSYAVI